MEVLPVWTFYTPSAHVLRIALLPEDEGGYSAHLENLPGVVGQGETVDEAIADIVAAFRTMRLIYGYEVSWERNDYPALSRHDVIRRDIVVEA